MVQKMAKNGITSVRLGEAQIGNLFILIPRDLQLPTGADILNFFTRFEYRTAVVTSIKCARAENRKVSIGARPVDQWFD